MLLCPAWPWSGCATSLLSAQSTALLEKWAVWRGQMDLGFTIKWEHCNQWAWSLSPKSRWAPQFVRVPLQRLGQSRRTASHKLSRVGGTSWGQVGAEGSLKWSGRVFI